jgi:hypothetical protein
MADEDVTGTDEQEELPEVEVEETLDEEGEEAESDEEESEEEDDSEEEEEEEEKPAKKAARPKVTFTPEQQEVLDAAISKKVRATHEAERRAAAAEQRLAELEQSIPKEGRPVIPPLPEAWDEDYGPKVHARDEAIRKAAIFDAQQLARQEQTLLARAQAAKAQVEAVNEKVTVYRKVAKTLGVKSDELKEAGAAVAAYGIHDDLAGFILSDDAGPLITVYLAKHPEAVEEMRGMNTAQAAVYIATKLKPRAVGARRMSKTPAPPASLGTRGGGSRSERGPKGATYA